MEQVTGDKSKSVKKTYDLVRQEFDQGTERKALANKLQSAGRDMETRREKLRCLLLEEASAWTREYAEKGQAVNEKKLEEMKFKAEEIRNRREAERKKIVEEKRIQQYFEMCEDLVSMKSRRFAEDAKRGQKYQMKEKEYMKAQEKEVENLWADVAKKEYDAKVARETEEARKKFQKDKEVAEVLLLQQKSIEAHNLEQRQRSKDEEAKLKEKNLKEIQEEETKVLGNKIKTRQKICSDLMQQIKRREDFLDRMTEEEQVLEKTFCKMAQAELEKELASKKYNRETLKRESQLYRESLAKLQQQRDTEEAELERILQHEKNKIEAHREEKMIRLKEARKKLKDEVLQGRMTQVEKQKEKIDKLKKQEEEELKMQEKARLQNAKLTAEHDNQIRLLKQKYAKDLLDQIEYNKALKVREIFMVFETSPSLFI
ncbi:cilia- and flagella-associated protein 53-like [Zootermopsis nevadensis]|uniref:cilia- and flagella-associated protein 53-like n=1 Tax=Zootermopsis nevadensis TaxID=136037 RepID=UPI000B8ED5E1|nr:cilia- and flagella-associated protein 53-like [Zootermopsis nevadensis]